MIVVVEPDRERWHDKRQALRGRGFEPVLAGSAEHAASIVDAFDVALVLVAPTGSPYGHERLVVQLAARPRTCVLLEIGEAVPEERACRPYVDALGAGRVVQVPGDPVAQAAVVARLCRAPAGSPRGGRRW